MANTFITAFDKLAEPKLLNHDAHYDKLFMEDFAKAKIPTIKIGKPIRKKLSAAKS